MPKVFLKKSDSKRIRETVLAHERAVEKTRAKRPDAALRKDMPNRTFAVRVTIDGGVSGTTGSITCTWTYTVTTLEGSVTLGTAKTPEARRIPNQKYTSTPAGSIGLACFDEDGAFMLIWANETTDCT